MSWMSNLHLIRQEQFPVEIVILNGEVRVVSDGDPVTAKPFASMAEARKFCSSFGLNLVQKEKHSDQDHDQA